VQRLFYLITRQHQDILLKNVIKVALVFYGLLLAVIWLTPIAFAGIKINSFKSDLAYAVTNSGGTYYITAITFVTAIIFAYRSGLNMHVLLKFLKQFGILFLMLACFALLNEFVIKGMAKIARPSHLYVYKHALHEIDLKQFYELNVKQRQIELKKMIDSSAFLKQNVDHKVLAHWIEEAGYSFPSGHSFNAFLLATVLSFSIKRSRKLHLNKFYFVPFVWATAIAVSRVALGAHAPIDVTFGSALGVFFGALLLYFETSRNIILHRQHHA
jgi:phosphatidylglycerophosphatase B